MQSDDHQMLAKIMLKKGREMLVTKGQTSFKFLGRIKYREYIVLVYKYSTTTVLVEYKPKCHAYVILQKRLISKFLHKYNTKK